MAWIQRLLLLWSMFHQALASQVDSCSKPNFNVENVDMSEIMETRFEVGRKLRLKCQRGYKRKAGTSNLIKCQNGSEFAKWSEPILQCIAIGGSQLPAPSTSSTETSKDLTLTIHGTSAMTSPTTSVELATLATSVPTSVEPATSRSIADHYTSTMDLTVKSGLGHLNTTWTAVRPTTSSTSTPGTESPPTVPSDYNQSAAVETTVTFSSNSATGTNAVTIRKSLAERTVNSPAASKPTSDIASTIAPTDINQTVTPGKSIGIVIGASTGTFFVVLLAILFLVWLLVSKNRIRCTRLRAEEQELSSMSLKGKSTVVNLSETGPLRPAWES
ncbi:interleukin-15 receptor subunit alpha-like isoform X5 [Narcine bancroftii]|uniref:interleukin-15 receptor subunit alpha-like isoform X5 n=1 Tax=Narcine bancroftii TaxID=1343680 RepID=UPI00383233F4